MRARHSSSGNPRLLPAAMVSGSRPATCLNLQPEVGFPLLGAHLSKGAHKSGILEFQTGCRRPVIGLSHRARPGSLQWNQCPPESFVAVVP
jgi:hypothetical protein